MTFTKTVLSTATEVLRLQVCFMLLKADIGIFKGHQAASGILGHWGMQNYFAFQRI